MSVKNVSDYTDRELLEKTATFMKTTAENTTFIKNYLIGMLALSILGGIIIASSM